MIIQLSKAWESQDDGKVRISIGFLLDSAYKKHRQDIVKRVATLWEAESTNIKFVWKTPQRHYNDCNVRISFADPGPNHNQVSSEIGTNALNITDGGKATMRLTWDDEEDMEQHILHEFGHMLGAHHEHLSPEFPYKWNHDAIYRHYEETIQDEITRTAETPKPSKEEITRKAHRRADKDMFYHLDASDISHSAFDDQSVMIYRIEADWIQWPYGGEEIQTLDRNYQLSYADGAILRKVYGGRIRESDADSSDSSEDSD